MVKFSRSYTRESVGNVLHALKQPLEAGVRHHHSGRATVAHRMTSWLSESRTIGQLGLSLADWDVVGRVAHLSNTSLLCATLVTVTM
jgi:hypothetical protein